MRRHDREIKEWADLIAVIRRAQVCRLALNDEDGFPYILPLNFGMEEREGKLRLFFHSALEGRKFELMKRDNRASFELDGKHQLQYFAEQGYCTYAYESIVGKGHLFMVPDDEKQAALACLMDHYHPGEHAYFNPAAIPRTAVYCLEVDSFTGKRKLPK